MDALDAIHNETAGEGMVRGPNRAWKHARNRRNDAPRALDSREGKAGLPQVCVIVSRAPKCRQCQSFLVGTYISMPHSTFLRQRRHCARRCGYGMSCLGLMGTFGAVTFFALPLE
jgi:hypothetical protein